MMCVSFFAQYLNECVYTHVHVQVYMYMYHCAFLHVHVDMYQINEGTLSTGEMYEYSLP